MGIYRDAVGRDVFPCDEYLWLSALITPFYATPLLLRTVSFYLKSVHAEKRNKFQLGDIHSKRLTVVPNKRRKTGILKHNTDAAANLFNAMASKGKSKVTATLEEGETKREVSLDDLRNAKALAGWRFGFIVLSLALVPFVFAAVYLYVTNSYYGNGCMGCQLYAFETMIFLFAILSIMGLAVTFIVLQRHRPDPLSKCKVLLYLDCGFKMFPVISLSLFNVASPLCYPSLHSLINTPCVPLYKPVNLIFYPYKPLSKPTLSCIYPHTHPPSPPLYPFLTLP